MILDIQIKLKNNLYYQRYIRENSYWYKLLNRNPRLFKQFEEEVKKTYHLRTSDRINHALDMIELVENLVSNLK